MANPTISEVTSPEDWPYGGTSATMRIYATETFWTADGQEVVVGIPQTTNTPCFEIACTVTDRVLSIPATDIIPYTTTSPTNPNVKYVAQMFDESDAYCYTFMVFPLPDWLGTSITWAQIALAATEGQIGWPSPYYWSAETTQAAIDAAVTGANAPKMTTTVFGIGKIYPAAANSADPIAAGVNTPVIIGNEGARAVGEFASFAAAVASIGSTPTTLLIPDEQTVSTSVVVPSTLNLEFTADGYLIVTSGHTVTINSKPNLTPGRRYFYGAGSVVFGTDAASDGVNLGWWISPDTDATNAIDNALTSMGNCSGGFVTIPSGRWETDGGHVIPDGVTIRGQGMTYDTSPSVTTIELVAENAAIFSALEDFRNVGLADMRLYGPASKNGTTGLLCEGVSPNTAFGVRLSNIIFNRLETGWKVNSTGGSWQLEDMYVSNLHYFNCDTSFVNNSINTSNLELGGEISVPASGVGQQLTATGLINQIGKVYGGAGTGIVVDGIHSGMNFFGCENEGNDYLLRNNLSDLNVGINWFGGVIQSQVKVSAASNFLLLGVEFTGANLFVIDAGIAARVIAIGCPGFKTALTDNSAGNAEITIIDGDIADISRQLNVYSNVNASTALIRAVSTLSNKIDIEYGQCDSDGVSVNTYKLYRRSGDGWSQASTNQSNPGYAWDAPHEIAEIATLPTSGAGKIVFGANTGHFFQFNINSGSTRNVIGTTTTTTANRLLKSTADTIAANSAITENAGAVSWTGSLVLTGTADVSGNFAIATNKFTVAAASGNTLVAGTFDVTGVTTLAGAATASTSIASPLVKVTSAAAPGSPASGDLWQDSTQKALIGYLSGIKQTLAGVVFTSTATATVANSTAATSIIGSGVGNSTLPASFFVPGKTVRVTVKGIISITGTPNLTILLKLGSTTICSTGVVAMGGTVSNNAFEMVVDITNRSVGVTGTVMGNGVFTYQKSTLIPASHGLVNTAATTIDTTSAQALTVTAEWSAADPANTISGQICTIEVLN